MSIKKRILNPKTPKDQQKKVLLKLLDKAEKTKFGITHKFSEILDSSNTVAHFQANIPVFDYESMHEQWWKDSLAGMKDICWPGGVSYFALTSGTSIGSSKYIPVTKDILKDIKKIGTKIIFGFVKKEHRHLLKSKVFLLGGTTSLLEEDGYSVGDLSGINVSKTPFWFRRRYVPDKKITGIQDWESRIDAIVKRAPEWDIGIISGIPSWVYLLLDKIIAYHKLNTIHDIWPNLGAFVHGGIAFAPYKDSFDKLLGKPLVYFDTYLASEGFLAYQKKATDIYMSLVLNKGIFFEFVPFDDLHFDDGKLISSKGIVAVSQVKKGVDYAVLISNSAGAWRYQIGDVIRFEHVEKCQIRIVGRTKLFLSVCGEHLSIDNMNMAIARVREDCKVNIVEFTVLAEKKEGYFRHKWFVGVDDQIQNFNQLKEKLDQSLMSLNDDYRTERGTVLRNIELVILKNSVFYDFLEKQGKIGGQHKFPKVLKGKMKKDWNSFLRKLNIDI